MKQTSQHIGFTICSNNYLGQANALRHSFLKHNPSYEFYFIVIDQPSDRVNYEELLPGKVIFIADIDGVDILSLAAKYDIIELNTCVKPSVFKYLMTNNPHVESMYYLDPDLYFYDSLEDCSNILKTASMTLTPHIFSEIERDGLLPEENTFLNFGIYNLGFIGVNTKHQETIKMLDWWEQRTLEHGYNNISKGYFVDQLWMNFAPLFYKDVHILESRGYNMGPWNLHERKVEKIDKDGAWLDDQSKLIFYHFSKIAQDDTAVSREYDRFTLLDFPLLARLYAGYKKDLETFRFYEYKEVPIAYNVGSWRQKKEIKRSAVKRFIRRLAKKMIKKTE